MGAGAYPLPAVFLPTSPRRASRTEPQPPAAVKQGEDAPHRWAIADNEDFTAAFPHLALGVENGDVSLHIDEFDPLQVDQQ
jgi:hypothetical protein